MGVLIESYSADLDFGTGEWTASAWVNVPVTLPVSSFPVIGSNVVTNGMFDTDISGWNTTTSTPSIDFVTYDPSGKARLEKGNANGYAILSQTIPSAGLNKVYKLKFDIVINSGSLEVQFYSSLHPGTAQTKTVSVSGTYEFLFYDQWADASITLKFVLANARSPSTIVFLDNISLVPIDYSVIATRGYTSGPKLDMGIDGVGRFTATAFDGITTRTVTTDAAYNTGTWLKVRANYQAGKLAILVNGVEVKSTIGAPLLSLNSRYNLQKYSEQFEQWSKRQNATVTADTTISPNNTLTADTITSGNSTDTEACAYYTHLGLNEIVIGSTMSCYFKAGTSSIVWIQGREGGNPYAVYNLSTQSLLGSSGCTPSIVDVGNGWYRIILANLTVGANYFAVGGKDVYTSGTPWGSGTWNSGNTIFAWGAQLETGSTAKTYQRVGAATDFDFQAPLTIGNNYSLTAPFPGSIALLKFSATVPSTEQSIWMYEQEKQMFREGAQVALPDANAIQDLAYDDLTDRWIAVSTTNKSTWTGLVRTASEAVSAGSYTKVSAASGIQLAARSTTNPGVDITIPAYNVKARAKKKAEKSKKLTNATAIYDFTPVVFSNATLTNGSNVMTVTTANTTGTPYIGMGITGTGIAAGTTIVGIVSGTPNSYYLSASYTGTTASTYTVGQSTFSLPVGYTAKLVYSGGLIQREGSTKAFTRTFDGFRETIVFGTSPGTSVVQIHAVKQ